MPVQRVRPSQRYSNRWTLGEWTIFEVKDHPFTNYEDRPLYTFGVGDQAPGSELFVTIEHAISAAIAAKYTGRRGAGGTGVGTAADWFMKMIGAPTSMEEMRDSQWPDPAARAQY
jgi:hypothetical protein